MPTATAATTQGPAKKKQSCPDNGDAAVEREEEYMDDAQEGGHEARRDERDVSATQMHEPSRSRPKDNMTGRAEEKEGRKSTAKAAGVGTYASVAKDASTPKKTRTSGQGAQQTNVPQQRRGAKEEVGHMPQGPAAKASMRGAPSDSRACLVHARSTTRRSPLLALVSKPQTHTGRDTGPTLREASRGHNNNSRGSFWNKRGTRPNVTAMV